MTNQKWPPNHNGHVKINLSKVMKGFFHGHLNGVSFLTKIFGERNLIFYKGVICKDGWIPHNQECV
jgi:hypothetical protein